jgi:hypothetical protein
MLENEFNEAQAILDRVKFELQCMIGKGCIDYSRLLAILEGRI